MSKEKKYQIRNQNILDTAEKLIRQKGYHHFKMSDISDELDIAKGTIYNHYPSKEDLLFALVYPKLEKLKGGLTKVVASQDCFEDKFTAAIRQAIECEYHQFLVLTFSDMAVLFQEKNKNDMERIQNQIIQEFRNIITLGIEAGVVKTHLSIEFLSHQILSALNPLLHSLLVVDSAKMTHDEFITQTTELLLFGIKKG